MTNNQSHRALIDAVSRAMRKECEAWVEKGGHLPFPAIATAALAVFYEALREPSEEMVTAARLMPNTPRCIWQAMLSASPLNGGGNE